MIRDCQRQVRVTGRGVVYGLDFGAVLALATARQAATPLLADLLPDIEPLVLAHYDSTAPDSPEE